MSRQTYNQQCVVIDGGDLTDRETKEDGKANLYLVPNMMREYTFSFLPQSEDVGRMLEVYIPTYTHDQRPDTTVQKFIFDISHNIRVIMIMQSFKVPARCLTTVSYFGYFTINCYFDICLDKL